MISVFELQLARDFLFGSCPPVYTLPGTWTKCNALIPHYNANPNMTFGISVAVITVLLELKYQKSCLDQHCSVVSMHYI